MKLKILTYCSFAILLLSLSCSNDADDEIKDEPKYETFDGSLGKVEYFHRSKVQDAYILVNNAQTNKAILMDKNAELVHDFPLNDKRIGNDVFLMDDGQILANLESEDPKIEIGGFGGILQILDHNGTVNWNFEYSSDDYILHHDAEMLPNGNILAQVWERKTAEEAQNLGYKLDIDVFPDAIIEINPSNNEIVWEWHAWDHLIQNVDDTKENYGIISDNPQKININYVSNEAGDIMHGNGIAYDPVKDVIFLSINFYSEIWVIDHSTTSAQASSSTGGNYGKGGDLIYRFGNPSAYDNPSGERLFYNNHYPNLLKGNDLGKILVFSNGGDLNQSTVYELQLPENYSLQTNQDNEPKVVWSFTDPELYSPKVSGAVRLPNGNTMITEGDFGIWEVTPEGDVVWKYSNPGFYWRAYHYDKTSGALKNLNL
ncbi:aryl-sulfate sulfotransferase [Flagellimonas pacifica]|uniref:Arylsulfotransferase (ASST) n=1 Tax=Flagellimonas pacifica TaxID=1247520 RepID=A0A285MWK9_9FLAO|nr:aryl-sulfate sulfotransferase [Allomuricauda parva]SNZ01575.1 Arylsulfotransferase (ASST) [Allomuricauda parva]